eukprot:m.40225 g.40225  ORF g.40225 m.40225 type:complete len:105 (-) comp6912_c0_seq2:1075-1389(-)
MTLQVDITVPIAIDCNDGSLETFKRKLNTGFTTNGNNLLQIGTKPICNHLRESESEFSFLCLSLPLPLLSPIPRVSIYVINPSPFARNEERSGTSKMTVIGLIE